MAGRRSVNEMTDQSEPLISASRQQRDEEIMQLRMPRQSVDTVLAGGAKPEDYNRGRTSSVDVIVAHRKMSQALDKQAKGQEVDEEDLTKAYSTDAHMVSLEELCEMYNTDLGSGLEGHRIDELREFYGPNSLTPPPKKPAWLHLLLCVFSGLFNILLWVSVAATIVLFIVNPAEKNDLIVAIVLAIVVAFTGIFQFTQERNAQSMMESFKDFLPPMVNVFRDGTLQQIEGSQLVPGDIVQLMAGEKVPADLRIIECSTDLHVDQASLTGESEPLLRTVEQSDKNPMETSNLCFFGTLLVKGRGKGMIVNTGDRTLMGRIAGLAAGTEQKKTPIELEIDDFVHKIAGLALMVGVTFVIVNFAQEVPLNVNFTFAISIIVANIPEGLIPTVMVALTLTAEVMKKKNALVKSLLSIETLGSCSVICSDKTGTLTTNVMTVAHVNYDTETLEVDTADPRNGDFDENSPSFHALKTIGACCNNAQYKKDGSIVGDASETAMLKFVLPHIGGDIPAYRRKHEQLHGIPFNSANKWQVSIHKQPDTDERIVLLKGAPERVLGMCDEVLIGGEPQPLTDEIRERITDRLTDLGKQGERVLACANRRLDTKKYPPTFVFQGDSRENANWPFGREGEQGLVFVGLMALIDPPRPGVPEAVERCQSAGIKVIMVTGDHPVTATAIARKVGIIQAETLDEVAERKGVDKSEVEEHEYGAIMVPGWELEAATQKHPDEVIRFWNRVLNKKYVSFARTSPAQKLIIVAAVQERGGIVAVTGDGVNDSPALKQANIGVAMGITGTDVAKDAADMILLDDNFASIVNGVEEGRIIFDNIKKSIAYTLCSKLSQLSPFVWHAAAGIPSALTTLMVILIDLGTDIWAAISLAHEKREGRIMDRPPRNPKTDKLVTWPLMAWAYLQMGAIQMAGCYYSYFHVFARSINDWPAVYPPGLWQADGQQAFSVQDGNHKAGNTLFFYTEGGSGSQDYHQAILPNWIEDNPDRKCSDSDRIAKHRSGEYTTDSSFPCWTFVTSEYINENSMKYIPCYQPSAGIDYYKNITVPVKSSDSKNTTVSLLPNNGIDYQYCVNAQMRTETLVFGQTAFYTSLILLQITTTVATKTSTFSVTTLGFSNTFMNISLISELLFGIFCCYVPGVNFTLGAAPQAFHDWLTPLPFMVFLFCYDELRKFLARKFPQSVWAKYFKW